MNAYHDIDGVPCTHSERLLTGILREEGGFDGTVVSDTAASSTYTANIKWLALPAKLVSWRSSSQ